MFTGNVTTGVTATPLKMDSSAYGQMKPQGPMASQLYSNLAGRSKLSNDRSMSAANAQQMLSAETQRSNAGLGWGQLANQNAMESGLNQMRQQNTALSLLQALGVF